MNDKAKMIAELNGAFHVKCAKIKALIKIESDLSKRCDLMLAHIDLIKKHQREVMAICGK